MGKQCASYRLLSTRPFVNPEPHEFFTAATWVGMEHKFGEKLAVTVLGKYIRSWRVQDLTFATAQALIPGARVEYKRNERWSFEASWTLPVVKDSTFMTTFKTDSSSRM